MGFPRALFFVFIDYLGLDKLVTVVDIAHAATALGWV